VGAALRREVRPRPTASRREGTLVSGKIRMARYRFAGCYPSAGPGGPGSTFPNRKSEFCGTSVSHGSFHQRNDALEVAGLGEEVERLDVGKRVAGGEEAFEVAHLGRGVAAHVDHGAGGEG